MVVNVFDCTTKRTCIKMTIILGTAVAITAVSACMAPLINCQNDDDDNDLESKTGIVHKPQSSLMTIFLNGLRKIGIISSSPVEEPQNNSSKVNPLFPCLPPMVPVIEVSKTSGNVPKNLRKVVHDPLVHPAKVLEDRHHNMVQQHVSIKLVLSRSTQSTQTDDFESAGETTTTTEDSGTFSAVPDPKTCDVGIQADKSSITIESTAPSSGQPPKSSAVDTQTVDRLIKPQIPKPLRAHPPKKNLVPALVHRDASVSSSDQNPSHQDSNNNQIPSDKPSKDSYRIRTTPKGRYDVPPSHHHSMSNESHRCCSCVGSHTSSIMTPSSSTMYPLHLPEYTSSRTSRAREREGNISDSERSLMTKLRKLAVLHQMSELRNCGDGSRHRPGMIAVQTNQSDHSSHGRRVHLAESSRSRSVIQDLDNEHYSNSEVMSSTRRHNVSSIDEEVLPDDSGVNGGDEEDKFVKSARIFRKDVDRVRKNVVAYREVLVRSHNQKLSSDDRNAVDECPGVPSRTPEVLLCDGQFNSRMYVSDVGTDYLSRCKKKKGIIGRVKEIFRRRFNKGNRSTFTECDTTFERNVESNLMGHSLH